MKRLFILSLTLTLILGSTAYAKSMSQILDNMKKSITSSGDHRSIDAQGRYGYTGGHYTYAAPENVELKFASLRGPSIKAGCSGIDIDMGSYSFLMDKERLVAFLESVVAQAPGYFVNLAMQTICPQCTELLNKLNSLMNMVNGMSLDACGALNAVGNIVANASGNEAMKATASGQHKRSDEYTGVTKEIFDSIDGVRNAISSTLKDIGCDIGSGSNCPVEYLDSKSQLTLLDAMAKKLKMMESGASKGEINILRGLIGDIYFDEGTETTSPEIKLIASCEEGDFKEVLKKMAGLDNSTNTSIFKSSNGIKVTWNPVDYSSCGGSELSYMATAKSITHAYFENIRLSYTNREELSKQTLAYLGTFSFPLYQIINQLSVEPVLLEDYLKTYENLAAATYLYQQMLDISKSIMIYLAFAKGPSRNKALYDENHIVHLQYMTDNVKELTKAAFEIYMKEYQKFGEEVIKIENQKKLTDRIMAQVARSPLHGSIVLSKSLGVNVLGFGQQ